MFYFLPDGHPRRFGLRPVRVLPLRVLQDQHRHGGEPHGGAVEEEERENPHVGTNVDRFFAPPNPVTFFSSLRSDLCVV